MRWSRLNRNGRSVRVLPGGAMVHLTNISLRHVSATVAWQFAAGALRRSRTARRTCARCTASSQPTQPTGSRAGWCSLEKRTARGSSWWMGEGWGPSSTTSSSPTAASQLCTQSAPERDATRSGTPATISITSSSSRGKEERFVIRATPAEQPLCCAAGAPRFDSANETRPTSCSLRLEGPHVATELHIGTDESVARWQPRS